MEGADAVERTEGFQDEALVVLHGAGVDLQLVVVVAGGVEAFDDLVYFHDDGGELTGVFLAVVLEADVAEDHDAVAGLDGVDYGDIFLDVAFAFKAFLALEGRGWGEVDFGGEFLGGEFGVLLEFAQDEDVGFV